MPSGRGCKDKGSAYERELANHLNQNLFGAECVYRAPLSGGGSVNSAAGGADLIGTPGIFVEAKRVERLNVREALSQATRNVTTRRSPDFPTVITRKNFEGTGDSLVVMRLDDWMELYGAWLREHGHLKSE